MDAPSPVQGITGRSSGSSAGVTSGAEPGEPDWARSGRLEVSEEERDGVRVVSVRGELDLATAAVLCSRLDAARHVADPRLLVDLGELDLCDSSGLRALVGAAREVSISAGRLAIVAPGDGPVARLLAVTGAAEFLPIRPTRNDALAWLAR